MSNLKQVRLGLGLTLKEAGDLAHVSYECVRRVENGIHYPRPETQDNLIAGYRAYALQQSIHFATMANKLA